MLPPSGPDAAWPYTGEVAPGRDEAGHGRGEVSALPPRTYAGATVESAVATGIALPWVEPCMQPCAQPWAEPWVPLWAAPWAQPGSEPWEPLCWLRRKREGQT